MNDLSKTAVAFAIVVLLLTGGLGCRSYYLYNNQLVIFLPYFHYILNLANKREVCFINKLTKTTIVYSLVLLIQTGIGVAASTAVVEPNPGAGQKHQPQYESSAKDHPQLIQEENERYEKEMKRRPNESDQEWKQRQGQETLRHEKALENINQGGLNK
ncbi:putative membrane protein [Propionispora sp. 2/2-37]|uniref:hypothetical protein n=1 Tax=Propionispora sp. 2/2-37 TaxID=1677858 RepID=UPI0006BB8DF6|nr:hypothetical protein [Propionispora sp. 2/2-37]CUH95648.1 putative membrane protein [Propionispora sp. 2/2-37]